VRCVQERNGVTLPYDCNMQLLMDSIPANQSCFNSEVLSKLHKSIDLYAVWQNDVRYSVECYVSRQEVDEHIQFAEQLIKIVQGCKID